LAEFRKKQYGNAAATVKKALRYDQQAVGYAVLALTQTHAGEWAAAKTSIEKGFELNQREKEWDDRLVVEILLKEAKGLVESKSPTHDASK
jgi:Tfp pilus assembly protein PilF